MSLVSEALRKARREAAERGDNLDGRTSQTTVIQVTRGPRTWQVVLVGAVVALIAAGLGALGVWWMVGRGAEPATEVAEGPRSMDTTPAPPAIVDSEPEPETVVVAPPEPRATATPAVGRRILPPPPRDAGAGSTPTPVAVAVATTEPSPTPPPDPPSGDLSGPDEAPASTDAALGPNEFLGEAEIDGRRLVLDYIAYLPSGAFAEINGTEVRLGSRIEGFTVESITAAAVTLRGPDGPIVLRAR